MMFLVVNLHSLGILFVEIEGIRRDEWVEDGSEGGRVGGRQSVEQVGRRTYNNGKRKRVAHLVTCYFL